MLLSINPVEQTQIELDICFNNLSKIEVLIQDLVVKEGPLDSSYLKVTKLHLQEIAQSTNISELTPALECDGSSNVVALEGLKDTAVKIYRFIVDRITALLNFIFGGKGLGEDIREYAKKIYRTAMDVKTKAQNLNKQASLQDVVFDFDLSQYTLSDKSLKSLPDTLAFVSEGLRNSLHLLTYVDDYVSACDAYPTTDLVVLLDELEASKIDLEMGDVVASFLSSHNGVFKKKEKVEYRLINGVVNSELAPVKFSTGKLSNFEARDKGIKDAIKGFTLNSKSHRKIAGCEFVAKLSDLEQVDRYLELNEALLKDGRALSFSDIEKNIGEFLDSIKGLMETYAKSSSLNNPANSHLIREVSLQRSLIQSLIAKQLVFSVVKQSFKASLKVLSLLGNDLTEIGKIGKKLDLTLSDKERTDWIQDQWTKYRNK